MAPPTVYDLQQQMRQAQQANQRQMEQMTALLMGKGKGKSHDKGKGKGASHDKGKGKGKGSNNAWAKAYSPAGIQVRANNHAKAFSQASSWLWMRNWPKQCSWNLLKRLRRLHRRRRSGEKC